MPTLIAPLEEARENLRVIRQTMERSTKYSTLSGLSGVLIGLVAIAGVVVTERLIRTLHPRPPIGSIAAVWTTVLLFAIAIDFLANKRRASRVGKQVISPLGRAYCPGRPAGFLCWGRADGLLRGARPVDSIWGVWMLAYGLAICAVGLFSVKPVSFLGGAFVLAGAVTLLLPAAWQLPMMALTFGGFHIGYGVAMARKHGW